MLSWVAAIPLMLASGIVLYIPGLVTGYALGLRRLWWWASAPLFSVATYTLTATLLPLIGIPWTLGTAALGAAAVSGIIIFIGRLLLRARFELPPSRLRWGWTTGALFFAGGGLLFIGCVGIGDPNAISQSWDSVFHYGSLRYAIETANASPFHLPTFTNPGTSGGYYPGAWHATASLVAIVSGTNIPLAISAFNMTVVALVWPASIILLTRQLVSEHPVVPVAAGALAAAFPAYPLNTLSYGVLFPFFLGIALLPVGLATLLQLVGLTRESRIAPVRILVAFTALSVAAIFLAHPSAFASLLVLAAVIFLVAFISEWGRASAWQRTVRAVLLLGFALLTAALFSVMRMDWGWPAQTSLRDAVTQTLTGSYLGAGLPLAMTVLVLAGIIFAVLRRDRSAVAAALMWVVSAVLYVIAAGVSDAGLRLLVNVWYSDVPRLGPVLVVTVIPLAAYALTEFWLLLRQARRIGAPLAWSVAALCLGSVLLTSGYPQFVPLMRLSYDGDSVDYIDSIPGEDRQLLAGLGDHGREPANNLLSTDERTLISRLPEHVPEGSVIVGSPWAGASFAYALEGYPVLVSYQNSVLSLDAQRIFWGFAFEADTPEMCEVLARTGAAYILDFGPREVLSGRHELPGIEHLDGNPAVTLVDEEGEAKLFKITACGLAP